MDDWEDWVKVLGGHPDLSVEAIAIDPVTASTIYLGTVGAAADVMVP